MTKIIAFPGMAAVQFNGEPKLEKTLDTSASSLPSSPSGPSQIPSESRVDQSSGAVLGERVTFKDFVYNSMSGRQAEAAKILKDLFQIDGYLAALYTANYCEKMKTDISTTMKTLQLKDALNAGRQNDAILLLVDCFKVSGIEAIGLYVTLNKLRY